MSQIKEKNSAPEEEHQKNSPPLAGDSTNSPPLAGDSTNSPPLEGCQAKPDGVVKRDTKAYMSLPYNPALRQRARQLRKAGILHEVLLWQRLKNGQLHGLDFDRQKIIGNYIVDFYCASKWLVIEVDGSSHNEKADADQQRDAYLRSLGLRVVRIRAVDVLRNLEGVIESLHALLTHDSSSGGELNKFPSVGGEPEGRGGFLSEEEPPRQATPATPPKEGNISPEKHL